MKEGGGAAAAEEEGAPSFVIDTQPSNAATAPTSTTAGKEKEKEKEREKTGKGKGTAEKEKDGEERGKGSQHTSSRWSTAPSEGGGPPNKWRGSIGRDRNEERRRERLAALEAEEEETEELYTVTILVPNEAMGLLIGRCEEGGGKEGRGKRGREGWFPGLRWCVSVFV